MNRVLGDRKDLFMFGAGKESDTMIKIPHQCMDNGVHCTREADRARSVKELSGVSISELQTTGVR